MSPRRFPAGMRRRLCCPSGAVREMFKNEAGGFGHELIPFDHEQELVRREGGESGRFAVEVDGNGAGRKFKNEAEGGFLHAAFRDVVKHTPAKVRRSEERFRGRSEAGFLAKFAQHGLNGCLACSDESSRKVVPEARADRLCRAALLKEEAMVGRECEKPHDDCCEAERAKNRSVGAADDEAAGRPDVKPLDGAGLGEAVTVESGGERRQ